MNVEIVGRAAELGEVTAFLGSLVSGPGVLVLEGEAGIGKSTVWGAGVDGAQRRGFAVLVARPAAAEAGLSYASLADLLGGVDAGVMASLPVPQRSAMDVVLLRADPDGVATGPRVVGAAVLSVLRGLAAGGPVLLAVDDVQWVDRSSRAAIEFALRRVTGRVGLLASQRPGGGPWGLSALPGRPGVAGVHVPVGPMSLGALHGVLQAHTGQSFPRSVMVGIQRSSGGNPFYALELAAVFRRGDQVGADAPLPATLAQLVQARVEGFTAPVRRALLAVASAAEPTADMVEQVIGGPEGAGARLLREAELGGVIALIGARVHFVHPLLAAGVYSAASAAERCEMHGRLAAVVAEPEEYARHLALSLVRGNEQTVAALDEAAERAAGRGAPAAAAELLELAVRAGGATAERRVRLARHHFGAGDPIRAREILEATVEVVAPGPQRAEALLLLARVRLHDDSYREAAGYLEQALTEPGTGVAVRVRIWVELLFVLVNLGRIPDALHHSAGAVVDAERLGDPALLAQVLAASVMIGFLSGHGLDEPGLRRALELDDPDAAVPVMVRPRLINSLLLLWTGRIEEGHDNLVSIHRQCVERTEESDVMFCAFHLVIAQCWSGRFADARLIARDTMERAIQLGTEIPLAVALSVQAIVAAYAGEVGQARQAAHDALTIFQRGSCLAVMVWPMITVGFVELSVPDYRSAAATLGPLAAAAAAMGYGEPMAAPFAPDAAEALIGVGRLDEAAVLVDQLESNGRRLDRAWAVALGARCRALLLAARGDVVAAVEAAAAALAEHDRVGMPFERARTLLVLGQLHRRRRQKRTAAAFLGQALEIFQDLGTPLWEERARVELGRVAPHPAAGGELTPSELRVAELAAGGLTNREVAGVLFVSPKTVEAAMGRIYHKLGIGSRAELGQRIGARKT